MVTKIQSNPPFTLVKTQYIYWNNDIVMYIFEGKGKIMIYFLNILNDTRVKLVLTFSYWNI